VDVGESERADVGERDGPLLQTMMIVAVAVVVVVVVVVAVAVVVAAVAVAVDTVVVAVDDVVVAADDDVPRKADRECFGTLRRWKRLRMGS